MVVEVGAQATPLGTFTKDKAALLAAVDAVRPSDTNADINRAMETLAASLTAARTRRIVRLQRRQAARGVGRAGEGARRP